MNKVTISDIAREAGVAKSTVSRYLNNGYIKDETRKKIQTVIDRTGFEPSAAAQNLKLKQTKTVGIVAPTMTSTSSGREITAMDETLREQGYSVIILTTNHDPKREIDAIEYLRSLRVDGIILIATNISKEHQRLQTSSKIPFLVMGQTFLEGTSVVFDDYHAGYTVGSYARDLGHKDVVYIGVSEFDDAVGRKRKQGVLDGLSQDESVRQITLRETTYDYTEAQKLVRKILTEHVPDMFICATDLMALAAYKEVREKGLRVPDDVSIAGFGGYEMSELLSPSMATIRFHNEEAGIICARTLISMIQNEPVASLQTIGFDFIKGASIKNLTQAANDKEAV